MTESIPHLYRLPLFAGPDRLFRNCLLASTSCGLLVAIVLLLAPDLVRHEQTVEEVSDRFARLILEKPAPKESRAAEGEARTETAAPPAPAEESAPEPAVAQAPPAVERPGERRPSEPTPAVETGEAGRTRATTEVAEQLGEVEGALGAVLADLSASLDAPGNAGGESARRRGRSAGKVRAARQAVAAAAVIPEGGGGGAGAVSVASALDGSGITIEGAEGGGGGGTSGTAGGRAGATPGVAGVGEYRSNASLLAVIRRYSAGIQFCYDQALNRRGGLRGKLVVSITVAPGGEVTRAEPVSDTLRDGQLLSCALAQIEGWRFPTIPHGTVTFRAPFLFTPPD